MSNHAASSLRPRRILHVSQPVDDGVAVVVGDLAEDLVKRGWEVAVACPDRGHLPGRAAAAGASHLAWEASRQPGPATVREVRALARLIALWRPDIVHLHSSKAGLAGRLAIRGRLPTVFSPHAWSFLHATGPVGRAALAWEKSGARWAGAIMCCSEDEAESGRRMGIRGRYRVIANTSHLDNPGWTQDQARGQVLGETDGPIAVCVGRLTKQKGQDILLTAWPRIRSEVPDARLILVGSGPEEDGLRGLATPGVEFRPPCEREILASWILSADVMVFPSRWEGMSLAVLEALELGRPVVVSDCQGMAEALAGGAGAMVPREDPVALARAVGALLADRDAAARLGVEAGRKFQLVHRERRERNMREYATMLVGMVDGT